MNVETLGIAGFSTAAGLLILATKRALIGDRPLLASIHCWWRNFHMPARAMLGNRCVDCGSAEVDLGTVSLNRPKFSRKGRFSAGSIERRYDD